MSGDEVDLLSILEVELLLEIPTLFGSAFRSCVARHLCLQNFSRPSTKYMFFVGDVAVHLQLGLAINKIYTKAKKKTKVQQNPRLIFLFCFEDDQN
jgi:hypothetical protein